MQNKAPQGKQDPIPTPELELEQYGVWVKAEPQDIVDEPAMAKSAVKSRADESVTAVLPSEQEDFADSFELDMNMTDGIEELEALTPTDDPEIGSDFPEEIESFDLEDLEADGAETVQEPFSSNFVEDTSEETALDITLDELDYDEPLEEPDTLVLDSEKPAESSFDTTDIDIEDFGLSNADDSSATPSLDDYSIDELATENSEINRVQDSTVSEDFEALDIDLQFDDTIPSDDSLDSPDAFIASDNDRNDVTSDFESIDIDAIGKEPDSTEITMPTSEVAANNDFEMSGSNISMDSFIDMDSNDASGIIPDMELENVSLNDEPIGFDDVQAVTDELGSKVSEPSSDLLQKIVLELSSIKDELVSLRGQLSSLKTTTQALPKAETESGPEASEDGVPGGFFDEEDDDTIALTGDELDNILNTADFTEEIADNESLDEHVLPSLEIPEEMELLPEDGVYETQESGIESIELPIITPTEDELEAIASQEGVTPITNLSEDTSFLESAQDEMILEFEMPLEEMPLVEPDASDLDSIIDSTFDTGMDELSIMEAANEEHESEIVLDFDADDEPVISTVDSFPEPLDEVEDALELEEFVEAEDLGGLELLSEETDLEELEELEELSLDEEDTTVSLEDSELIETSPEGLATISLPEGFDSAAPLHNPDAASFVDTSASIDQIEATEPYLETVPAEIAYLEQPLEEVAEEEPLTAGKAAVAETTQVVSDTMVPDKLKHDVKSVLLYLDQLLASLPEEKIEEFASSEYYDTYKRLFDDLGLL